MTPRRRPAAALTAPRTSLALLALLAAGLLAAHALLPFLLGHQTLQDELAVQFRVTSGLRIEIRHARFVLLPRPRVVADAVRIDDPAGTLTLDADAFSGDVRLLPLVVGRVEISSVLLRRPRLAIDLAAAPLSLTSTLGQALVERGRDGGASQRLGTLAFEDGTISVSRGGASVLALSRIDAALDWSGLEAAAVLTASLDVGGERTDVSLWLGQPLDLLRGAATAVELHGHAPSLDIVAKGSLSDLPASAAGSHGGFAFKGHITADAAAIDRLLAATPGLRLPAAFTDASLDADARIVADADGLSTIDLQGLSFRGDGIGWEGTLGFRRGAKPLVSATLATDRLMLAPFLATLMAPDGALRPRGLPGIGNVDLDLRISAARLAQDALAIEDAALSVSSRGGRLAIALIDGRLWSGALKARLSLARDGDATELRANAALTGADASVLPLDAAKRQLATGTLSLTGSGQSRGDTAASLLDHLVGSLRASLVDGSIGVGERHAVDRLDLSASVADGIATIAETATLDREGTATGRGTLDLRSRILDMHVSPRDAAGSSSVGSAIAIGGPLDRLAVSPEPPH